MNEQMNSLTTLHTGVLLLCQSAMYAFNFKFCHLHYWIAKVRMNQRQ